MNSADTPTVCAGESFGFESFSVELEVLDSVLDSSPVATHVPSEARDVYVLSGAHGTVGGSLKVFEELGFSAVVVEFGTTGAVGRFCQFTED